MESKLDKAADAADILQNKFQAQLLDEWFAGSISGEKSTLQKLAVKLTNIVLDSPMELKAILDYAEIESE